MLLFNATVFVFREQLFALFSSDPSLVGNGVVVLTAQLMSSIFNGFAGLMTSLFQATGRSAASGVMSVGQGVVFVPVVILGKLWFGLPGIIWSLTVSEGIVFLGGVVLVRASRHAIDRGLAAGSMTRTKRTVEQPTS